MSIFSDIGSGISDLGGDIFGTGKKPGVLGTGQETFNPYQINANADKTANGGALQASAQQNIANVNARATPTMQAAQVSPVQTIEQQNIGNASLAQQARLAPASTMGASQIATGNDNTDRSGQNQLANMYMQQAQGNGPSLAGLQLQQATDRNNAQAMGMAASMQGQGNAALAQRNAMLNASSNDQAAAMASAQTKIQEQQAAMSGAANTFGNLRSADQSVATNQANLNQSAASANMAAQNQFALENAANQQQVNLTNAGALNQQALNQANLNMGAQQFNATQGNTTALAQAQMNQQANSANQQATLANQQQQDAMNQYYYGAQLGMDQADRNAAMQMQQMQAGQNANVMSLQAGAYNSAAQRQGTATSGLLSAGAGLASLSDENEKTNISKLSDSDLDEVYGIGSGSAPPSTPAPASAPAPNDPSKNPFAKAMGGKGAPSGGAGGAISGFGGAIGGMLGQVLNPGGSSSSSSPVAATSNATGDYRGYANGGMNVQATGAAINNSTVIQPTEHPGAMPMGSSGGLNLGPIHLSDKNEKKDIEALDNQVNRDVRKVGAYEYEYKNPDMPGAAPGKHVSPMAQELEKTRLFKGAVSEDPNGTKYVDYSRTIGGLLAGMAMQNRRIDKIEAAKRRS